MSKSNCEKHYMLGPFLTVQMWFARRCNYSYGYNSASLHWTVPDYTTLDYTTAHNSAAHYTTPDDTTARNITADYTTLHYTPPQLQLQLHYTGYATHNYNSTVPQLQLQLHHTTLHPVAVSPTIATTSKNIAPTTCRSISGFALPSMHHSYWPLLLCPIFDTSATCAVRLVYIDNVNPGLITPK